MRSTPGDGRTRFCGQCRQNVYNVEAMSRGEARRLIAAREGRVCVRILRRPDGTVVVEVLPPPEPVPVMGEPVPVMGDFVAPQRLMGRIRRK
jgi:hypothetical protein